jgi:hypothetical protein
VNKLAAAKPNPNVYSSRAAAFVDADEEELDFDDDDGLTATLGVWDTDKERVSTASRPPISSTLPVLILFVTSPETTRTYFGALCAISSLVIRG